MTSSVRNGFSFLGRSISLSRKPAALLFMLAVSATVIASPLTKPVADSVALHTAAKHRWYQVGKASWYGRAFQGKRTATGERFDMNSLTCAHRTLPLGSWLRVTNLGNKKSTFVRVNDRGPYSGTAMIDLSYAAAQRLGLLGKASVRVEKVSPNDPELAQALVTEVSSASPLPIGNAR